MAQTQTGATINTNISLNKTTGVTTYTFNDPFNMLINLYNSSDVITIGSLHNDKFNLLMATGVTINGSNGNNIYNVGAAAAGLNGNIIRGGTGYDFITLTGANSTIDLTQGANTGVEAVVGNANFGGQTVVVNLSQLTSSALTNGGTGRAFVSVIGSTGVVDVVQTGKFKFVGSIDSAGHGFDAAGTAVTGAALTALQASVTKISQITGNLASIYAGLSTGAIPAGETAVSLSLNAYVFSDGLKSYTVWTDGVVTPVSSTGTSLAPVYQPLAAAPAAPFVYNSVAVFNKVDKWASAGVFTDTAGNHNLMLAPGNTGASSAVNLVGGVANTVIHGDAGNFGTNYFALGGSGGNNTLYGSKVGNLFDMVNSTSLQDVLIGGNGFDVVKAVAAGANVNLTATNAATSHISRSIDAVVGKLSTIQTVELDVATLKYQADATGAKTAVFAAYLGSTADTLDISGAGKWVEVATFTPGSALPLHASALAHADILNTQYGAGHAETALTGHLYEQVDLLGHAVKYLTVYTDATIVNELATPSAATLAHMGLFI